MLEIQAANVVDRQPVKEPLQTGITAIDAMTPIGRGQRELIIGDRQTGKTAVAIDAIIAQRDNWASGDPRAGPLHLRRGRPEGVHRGRGGRDAERQRRARLHGGRERFGLGPDAVPVPRPVLGAALGAYWMYEGLHALAVYDDLSKQATAYRTLSLLLRRPPGREAYPGDVFYLHSRLLERAAKLSDRLGAGSLTALPIVETKGNDISAYIPTNVISITDGQIYLEPDLFFAGSAPRSTWARPSRAWGERADQGDEEDRRDAADHDGAVPSARGVRAVRVRARPSPRSSSRAVPASSRSSSSRSTGPCRSSRRSWRSGSGRAGTSTRSRSRTPSGSSTSSSSTSPRGPTSWTRSGTRASSPTRPRPTLKQALEDFTQAFVRSDAGEGSEAGVGQGAPRDPVKPDVGWDRLSSADDEDEPPGSGG